MRNLIALFTVFVFVSFTQKAKEIDEVIHIEPIPPQLIKIEEPSPNDLLIEAIIFVESSGNDSAYCKVEDAVGCLQIRRVMVREVNRILKKQKKDTRYKMGDRWNREKSIEMFNIYTDYYSLETPEEIARAWNGGPKGSTKNATIRYWNKVKNKLKNI